MIEIVELTKVYRTGGGIRDVTFEVKNGEIVGFVGVNGAGKTTTIETAVGVKIPQKGDVRIDGKSILKEKIEASKLTGWVPEIPSFDPDMRAEDYFLYVCGLRGIPGHEAKELAKKLFEEVGLSGHERKRIRQYSQGMRKRFALAISMISNPSNFLFDEVLNGLDPEGIRFFREFAMRMRKENAAVLFSSHILSEVQNLADRVVFIHKGRVVKVATMAEIESMSRTKTFRVRFATPESAQRSLELLKGFGKDVKVEKGVVVIEEFNGDIEGIARAVKSFPDFLEMGWASKTLEDIFFETIGEAR
jgi:ABC-2 type transport system ATP-binding protein